MKYLFSILFISIGLKSYSQMVVSAPTLEVLQAKENASQLKQLGESIKQSAFLTNTANSLKEANELYSKVSSKITSSLVVKDVLNRQALLIKQSAQILKDSRKATNTSAYLAMKGRVESVLQENQTNVSLLQNLLAEGFKMKDAERLELIMEVKDSTKEKLQELNAIRAQNELGVSATAMYDNLLKRK